MTQDNSRADFEIWYEQEYDDMHGPLVWVAEDEAYEGVDHQLAFQAWLGATRQARASASEDTARLDWLLEDGGTFELDEGHRGWYVLDRLADVYLAEDCATAREAIDVALRHIKERL